MGRGRLARVAGLLSAAVPGAAGAADEICGRPIPSFEEVAADLARDPKLKPAQNGGPDFLAYAEDQPFRQWFVTRPGFPDVKAVVCRELQQENGRFVIRATTRCFGPKPICDRLAAAFQQPG